MCRIVEFETPDQARDALAQLHERSFMGRDVFIREVGLVQRHH